MYGSDLMAMIRASQARHPGSKINKRNLWLESPGCRIIISGLILC